MFPCNSNICHVYERPTSILCRQCFHSKVEPWWRQYGMNLENLSPKGWPTFDRPLTDDTRQIPACL